MPLVRMLVSWGPPSEKVAERFSNTLYFNVSNPPPLDPADYQDLADDLRDIYANQGWTQGAKIEVRAYDMADAKPREERAYSTVTMPNTFRACPRQIAVCLSFYADRNLPRRRGRIYTGPWVGSADKPTDLIMDGLISMAQALAGLGGVNVDWSVYSPTNAAAGQDSHYRVSEAWVDDSWDVIRSRKLPSTRRKTVSLNG